MNAIFTQDKRLGKLTTVLGKDTLVLLRFDGTDHVNDLFTYRIEALSTEPNLDFDGIIGTHASVEIESQNDGTRVYDGLVTEAKWAGVGENGNKYALTLRPWLWVASQRRNQRIFHNKTVVQIIEELIAPYSGLGDPALEVKLSATYPDLEYTVQYRESDLAFATRLMERFGISYHFTHKVGTHTLVLTDTIEAHDVVAGAKREYKPVEGARQANKEHFWEWHPERRMTTGAIRLTDYNFKTPNAAMEVDRIGDAAYEQGQTESYDYPGDYLEQGVGKDVVGLRTLQERGQDARHRAIGDCTSLGAGMTLTLTGDQVNGVKGADYLCLSATHSYISDAYGSGDTESDGHAYSGEYVLMPATAPLAPELKTPRAVVQGPQTAVVVGEGEIDCDEYGRILVHFHWDLAKAYSMRCRVSQNWASKGWGGMVIPRIGMEVVVEFLEGDPDKPLVTGCVYNGKNDVPYPLPEHKTRSTFKTDSHKANYDGFNELRFEDERFNEEVFLRAQKDLSVKVQHNEVRIVDENKGAFVRANEINVVGRDQYEETNGSRTQYIGPENKTVHTARKAATVTDRMNKWINGVSTLANSGGRWSFTTVVQGVRSTLIKDRETKTVENGYDKNIGGKYDISSGDFEVTSEDNAKVEAARHVSISAGDSLTLSCGQARIQLQSDGSLRLFGVRTDLVGSKSVDIDGTEAVRIDTPSSNVELTPAGVKVNGPKIDLN